MKILILNADYSPIGLASIAKAVGLVMLGKTEPVGSDTIPIGTVMGKYMLSSVIRLKEYRNSKYKKFGCTPRNVFMRDGYKCIYCSSTKELTLDHVVPKCRGGKNTWGNLVTCCHKCNARKGSRMLSETGFALKFKPFKPTVADIVFKSMYYRDSWECYISPYLTK